MYALMRHNELKSDVGPCPFFGIALVADAGRTAAGGCEADCFRALPREIKTRSSAAAIRAKGCHRDLAELFADMRGLLREADGRIDAWRLVEEVGPKPTPASPKAASIA